LGVSGLPCIQFTGGTPTFLNGPNFSGAQPFSVAGVIQRSSGTGYQYVLALNFSAPCGYGWNNTANTFRVNCGSTFTFTVSDAAWHSVGVVYNNTSAITNVDGTAGAGTSGSSAMGTVYIGTQTSTSYGLSGYINELVVWKSALTAGQLSNLCHNQYAYFGTTTAC
jgi:hypothetical protein